MTSHNIVKEEEIRQFAVRLVGLSEGSSTGLSRYARSLYQELTLQEVTVGVTDFKTPSIPPFVGKLGFDSAKFFSTFPVALPDAVGNTVTHLTTQNHASAVAFKKVKRLVVTVHDLITLCYNHYPEFTTHLKYYDKFFNRLAAYGLKKARMLIAVSEYTRQDIIRLLSYPSDRIKVVYEGVDRQNFRVKEVPTNFYQRYNLREDIPYLLNVGSEDPRKNIRRLLAAFAKVSAEFPTVRLLKVGAAEFRHERQYLLDEAKLLGISDKVVFLTGFRIQTWLISIILRQPLSFPRSMRVSDYLLWKLCLAELRLYVPMLLPFLKW